MFKFIIISFGFLFLFSCSNSTNKKQFEFSGGSFKMCIGEGPSSTIARNVTDVHSATIFNQVMEGLVSFNPADMKITPQIASSWTISADQLTYQFTIREGILFHECDELSSTFSRTLTTEDIVYSFELIAKKDDKGDPTPAYSSFFRSTIKGIDAFHQGKAKSISGISVKDNIISIKLAQIDTDFLYKLANVNAFISSKKLIESGNENLIIGTGPFVYNGLNDDKSKILLTKNQDYYLLDKEGNALPYLDQIELIIEHKKLEELTYFEEGKIDFISGLPTSRISSMLEGRMNDFNKVPPLLILRNNPLLATNYYFFNMNDKRFKELKVRKAFNYAIDRNKITQEILRGQAYENGVYGIVPPISSIFRGYDYSGVKENSYDFNPELAKKLLAEAGYPNGENFGSVNLRVNLGDIHSAVAEEISDQIFQTLGINVNIDATTFEQKNKDADFLNGDMFRIAWFADYISPESFLINFYGKIVPKSMDEPSQINQSRYINPNFDKLFEAAKKESKLAERLKMFAEAEKELMKDPPLMALWYNGDIQLIYSKVRNFNENPLNYINLKEVYIKEWTKTEFENRIKTN